MENEEENYKKHKVDFDERKRAILDGISRNKRMNYKTRFIIFLIGIVIAAVLLWVFHMPIFAAGFMILTIVNYVIIWLHAPESGLNKKNVEDFANFCENNLLEENLKLEETINYLKEIIKKDKNLKQKEIFSKN